MRRFTRLTNAFSKKVENMAQVLAVYFRFYNSARVHQTLRATSAMEAKMRLHDGTEKAVADHVWTIEEIVGLVPEEDVVILK